MSTLTPRGRAKRQLPLAPGAVRPDQSPSAKSVTFNKQTIETSVGGTQSIGRIKRDILSTSSSTCSSVSVSLTLSDHMTQSTSDSASSNENTLSLTNVSRLSDDSEQDENLTNRRPLDTLGVVASSSFLDTPLKRSPAWKENEYNKENFSSPVKELRRNTFESRTELCSPSSMRTPTRRYTLDDKLVTTPECYSHVQMADMDLPRFEMSYDRDLHSPSDEDSKSSVTVAVRVRPFTQREKVSENCGRSVVSMRGNETEVTSFTGQVYRFAYDFSFWSFNEKSSHFSSQEHVYKMLAQPLLVKAFEGYNTCLFAYGQTGSGKSYSIMGQGNEAGIIPRFCQDLFSRAEQEVTRDSEMVKINVEISFFEIYNEKIHDLLATSKDKGIKKSTLKVREDPNLGPFVDGLDKYVVNSFRDVEKWIEIGNSNRATAATAMNDKSSRSHSVFTLVLTQTKTEEIEGTTHDSAITSKINLVDLAGSERQSQAQTTGQRQKEGAFINKSLLTLGIVISELAEQKKGFIPVQEFCSYKIHVYIYIDRLLKESLGGNSKTAMIATISPSHHHIEETLSTLRYARQASRIVNTARVNEDQKTRIIKKLRSEIEQLRKQTGPVEQSACLMEIQLLKEQLQEKEKECQEVTRSWQEKLKRSEERKAIEAKQLEKAGIAFKVDNKLPNLVNLNEDPILSEMLLYVIKEGITRVGRMCPESAHEIQLNGALIAENHCMINNEDTVVSITPIDDAPTYVNGELVSDSVILHHGDRVNLGGDHYFRFNHPMEVSTKAGGSIQQEIKDFEFAKQELYRAQEKRLLDEAKKQAQEEVKKAEQEWISQKIDYEDKLAELEKELRQQNEKGQKAEQSRQEAQEYIQKLQKQKTLLELEVKAGKNRQQLEIKAAQKVASQPAPAKTSPLLELLESERQKAATRLEELKQKRSDMFTVPKKHAASDLHCARADLYKVELLVREANKISQFLKKSTVFSRQDYLEEESMNTMIKVLNTKLGVCTYWTVPKFEEKLIHMRDMYQNDGDSSADDEIFNDPSDNWEEDSSTTSPTKSPKRLSFIHSIQYLVSCILGSVSSMMTECMCTHQPQQSAIFRQYKTFALGIVDKFQGLYFEESVADKIAHSCNSIKQSVLSICDLMNNLHNNSISESSPSEDSLTILGQDLVSSLNNLTSNCAVWYSVCLREQRQSTVIDDLTHKLKDQARLMGNQIVLFLQGCENEIDSLLRESSTKIIDCVHSICKLTGELALATDTRMVSLELLRMEEQSANHLSPDVCQSFLCGSDLLVEKSLQGALGNLEELESRAKKICQDSAQNTDVGEIPRTIEVVVSATKDLLAKCQDIQVEVDTSMRESFDMIPPQYYSLSYRRSRGLMTQISNMQNDVNCLVQTVKPVSEGKDGDIRKVCYYAELIQNGATKLISTTNDRPRQSECLEISVLSDAQAEELETSARILCSATKTLINSAGKISNVTTQVLTPRSKRALPISPDKTLRTSVQRNLPLKNGIGKRDGLAKGVLSNQPSVLKSQS
ncbi:hypothetical protein FSP39_016918 [Pinctada imbricata]|uniref:Kinesin-like protein KIF14 n=1 Tax=Pinctada imbricata TaxID=66713 RepID=A0AA89BZC8_PINIB|nr:hypothetical protein FSP39_016918 [Pinctada imbricata]